MQNKKPRFLVWVPFLIIFAAAVAGWFLGETKPIQQRPTIQFQQTAAATTAVKTESEYRAEMIKSNVHGGDLAFILDQLSEESKTEDFWIKMIKGTHGDDLAIILGRVPKKARSPIFWKRAVGVNPEARQYMPKRLALELFPSPP